MKQSASGPSRWRCGRHARDALVTGTAALMSAIAAGAENGEWTVQLDAMHMDALGHDRQVLTIRQIDLDTTPTADTGIPVALETEEKLTTRLGLQYSRAAWEEWAVGFDVIFFGASQGRFGRNAAAGGAAGADRAVFDVAGRSFESNNPDEVLYFNVLGDTDLEVWTTDIYGIKALAETPERRLLLVLGLRNADFDNDYHGIAGIEGVNGSLIDASSNYDRMIGPLLGLAGEIQLGRNTLTAYIGQSAVFGSADLGRAIGDFEGPASDAPAFVAGESFERLSQDVSIPMTELRITWLHPLGERVSLGVTANASIWFDVPVPPGISPTASSSGFDESTIVFFGIGAAIRFNF